MGEGGVCSVCPIVHADGFMSVNKPFGVAIVIPRQVERKNKKISLRGSIHATI